MPVLTPDQFEVLQRILTDAFDRRGIAELVRTKLGDRLDNLVGPDQPTPGIVFDLLTWIDKRDMHKLEILLQGAIAMKPENDALRAFCEQIVPGALKPPDWQPSVTDLTAGASQPFIGVPPRIASFRGRVDELDRLNAILMPDKPAAVTQTSVGRVAVQGMGGVGKTALAIEYAHRFRGLYAGVCWCPAETHPGLLSALAGLAVTLGAAPAEEVNLEKAANAALRRLAEQRATWLLIYDNAPAPDAIANLLPSAGARVLITSRFSDWSELAVEVTLDVLLPEEAVALLQERTGRSDAAGAKTLAEVLGHLPLALDHAGAYCKRTGVQFADYAKKALSLINAAPRGVGYPKSVAATFDLAITRAVTQCAAAETLMAYLAQCAPERIPMILVEGAVEDDAERQEALAALAEVSLVKHDPFEDGTSAITVHRLVQAVARARSETNGSAQDAVRRLFARLVAIYPDTSINYTQSWPVCSQLTPHLLARREAGFDAALKISDWPKLLERASDYFHGRAAYSLAIPLVRDALAINEKALGPEHPNTASSLCRLALLFKAQGDLARARPLLERVLAIDEKELGPEHLETATSLSNLGYLLQNQGDLAAARPLFERALAIRERALGPEHLATAYSLGYLAGLLHNQGDFAGARPLYERALAIYEKKQGPEHPLTATNLYSPANLLRDQGDFAGARPLCERALASFEKAVGPRASFYGGGPFNALAALLHNQGDLAAARPLYERALAICEKVLGPEHPTTNSGRSDFALLLLATGEQTEALALAETALGANDKVLGRDHPHTKYSARVTADALDALGRTEEASAVREKYGIAPETPSAD